ncbi:hypothetical protein U9M48_004609 [Paspalum notatum var. saurae]|uniref:Reverse transcriptase Ty1/copia-type domain-containing protein n=1 Tax=Paspalum notatum var. saurae TaxID=547442 RepID=A0AAQ3PVX2_PASNO
MQKQARSGRWPCWRRWPPLKRIRRGLWRHSSIGLKWVFKLKSDEHGEIVKHKTRLIAKGYVQQHGINFEEVFAPITGIESVRVVLALAAHCGWSVHHMDVKSTFLNGELVEEVYGAQPPWFTAAGHGGKVLRLCTAFSKGVEPQARHKLGFTKSKYEHGLYMRGAEASRLVVGVYVDDLLIMGERLTEIDAFKVEMKKLFCMSDLGPLSYYLGIESAYAIKFLKKPDIGSCNACTTPTEVRLKLAKQGTLPVVDATLYRSLIGSLRYLLHTRLELTFAIGYLSRFMEELRLEHMVAMKHLLCYIKGTSDHGLLYTNNGGELNLLGYSGSDMVGDVDVRKSTTGVIFFLGSIPGQQWRARRSGSGSHHRRLLEDIIGAKIPSPMLKMDNQSAIALSKNLVLRDRSKHIDMKFHFIHECVDKGDIDIELAGTQEQFADILTKSLRKKAFQELRGRIEVIKLN